MKKYKLNKKVSKEMYLRHKGIVTFKGCYDNVYNIVTKERMLYNFLYSDYKVCYGAWSVGDKSNLYAKHCFFLVGGKVVDPTYYTTTEIDRDYLIFKELSIKEYIDMLLKTNGDVSLMREMNKIQMELMSKGILLIG